MVSWIFDNTDPRNIAGGSTLRCGGFWQAINEGVEVIEVKQGYLYIKLKE